MAVLFEVDLPNLSTFGYGSTQTTVETNLANGTGKFPGAFIDEAATSWGNIKLDAGGGTPYIETRSTIGGDSKLQWRSAFAGGAVTTAYMRTSYYFDSRGGSNHGPDGGFDWGDGNGTPTTNFTGGKMNGLCQGALGNNTGNNLLDGAWSGRHMWRGNRKSDGIGGSNREATCMELYYYGYDEGTQKRYNFCNSDDPADAIIFTSDGTTAGTYGDPRTTNIPLDTWIHVLAGYSAPDSASGWYQAWTWIDGTDTSWQPQLNKTGMRYRPPGSSGVDSYIFQQFWGGNTAEWRPDNLAYTRTKDIGVYTTLAEAETAFGLSTGVIEITDPTNGAVNVDSPLAVSGTAPNDGSQGYEVSAVVDGNSPTWNAATYTPGTESYAGNSSITIPQNGETIRVRARRWS